jgi:putative ABC transport system permease protein
MTRLALLVIRLATPRREREWVVGDTVEELARLRDTRGERAARRWLHREMVRVLAQAPRHRLAASRAAAVAAPHPAIHEGDGPVRDFFHDIRYTLRLLGRAPAFTAIAVATLALGIGANAAIFAVVNAVLLKPLPFADAERLMLVHILVPERMVSPERARPGVYNETVWSYPKYRTFTASQQVFDEIAFFAGRDLDLSGDGEPQRVRGEVVTERYPSVLGVAPLVGRPFTWDEVHNAGTPRAAMISHGLWTRRFGGDPAVVGRTIRINATPYTVIAVLPRGFRGLIGNADVWVPLAAFEPSQLTQAQSHSYTIVARRKHHVSEQTAAAAVEVLGSQVDAAHARRDVGMPVWKARANSMYASRVDADVRRAALVLLGAVGFVLLIACVNLTNLVAAKAMARRREVAVRVAIGASRGRIMRQFLTEGVVLSALGAAGGLFVAFALLGAAAAVLPEPDVFFRSAVAPGTPRITGASGLTRIGASMIGVDVMTLVFTSGVALVTAMLVSLLPAAQASLLRPVDALKKGMAEAGARWIDARGLLVTAQIALALILLAGAGLMIRSAERLRETGIGVNPRGLFAVRIDLPAAAYDGNRGQQFYAQLLERVSALPGIDSAALGLCAPVSGGCNGTIVWFPPAKEPFRDGRDPAVGIHWITPGFLDTLGVTLLRGRNITDQDRAGQPKVLLVSETAARRLWPNDDPIGKRMWAGQGSAGSGDASEVVGVVSDVRYRAIETAPVPDVYLPLAQSYQSRMRLFVRSGLDPSSLAPAIAREVQALDANLPLSEIKTMDERVADAMWRTRIGAWLLSAFAALAVLLTAIGIFGVMAQAVAQRTTEIGIRMALGAQAGDVLGLVLRRAAVVTAAGLVIGAGGALQLTRLIAALLYGVEPGDPATFVSVAVLLGVIALLAGYIPARRATRVDAIAALRAE